MPLVFLLLLTLGWPPQQHCTSSPPSHPAPPAANGSLSLPGLFLEGEAGRWAEALTLARRRNVSLAVFYHTSLWRKYGADVIAEQLLTMDGRRPVNFFMGKHPLDQAHAACPAAQCAAHAGIRWLPSRWASLLDGADGVFLNVAGQKESDGEVVRRLVQQLPLHHAHKVRINFTYTQVRPPPPPHPSAPRSAFAAWQKQRAPKGSIVGEWSTLIAMRAHCEGLARAGKEGFAVYLHNKGGCCSRKDPPTRVGNPTAAWREQMNTFILEFPSICLRALLEGYAACGVALREEHYSGNFFWVRCDHLAALPFTEDKSDAWTAEHFLFAVSQHKALRARFAHNCAYSPHTCSIWKLHLRECPRHAYRDRVAVYVHHRRLPRNAAATAAGDAGRAQRACWAMRRLPYQQQRFWSTASAFPFVDSAKGRTGCTRATPCTARHPSG